MVTPLPEDNVDDRLPYGLERQCAERLHVIALKNLREDAVRMIVEEPDTYEFRLFSSHFQTSKQAASVEEDNRNQTLLDPFVQRIRLQTPPIPAADALDSVQTRSRPLGYYIASSLTPVQRANYAAVALTGEDVRRLSSHSRPGLALPWRVIHLPPSSLHPATTGAVDDKVHAPSKARKKTRLGKKSRVRLRRKMQAKRTFEDRERAKVERTKEKNRKRNRVKQLRKREKAREAKLVTEEQE